MKKNPLAAAVFRALSVVGTAGLFANAVAADQITFSGTITQSTQDGTGPAVNNPSLNNIISGDAYSVILNFAGAIHSPSPIPHDLSGSTMTFVDTTNAASESSFGFISLTVSANGIFNDFSLLACLTTGSSCAGSNQLTANWRVLATDLNSSVAVAAIGLDPPHPLDLLEDDGTTDIQGSITSYSYTSANPVPEPSSLVLVGPAMWVVLRGKYRRRTTSR